MSRIFHSSTVDSTRHLSLADTDDSWNWETGESATRVIKRSAHRFCEESEQKCEVQEPPKLEKKSQEELEQEELQERKRRHKEKREAIRNRYGKLVGHKVPKSPFGIKPAKSLQLGWYNIPMVSRILISGVFLVILSLTTPFWAYVRSEMVDHATFGLWHFCIDDACWSIRDNLVRGHDVPLWYMVSQMTFTIGVICSALAMFVVASNHHGNKVKLSPTVNSTMVMMLVVGVLQMSTSLYTFASYFEDVSFLYEYTEEVLEVDYYGSFWAGVIGVGLILIGALILFFDEEIMPYPSTQVGPPFYDKRLYFPDYPDNVLFRDMSMWDEQLVPPIVSQRELPYIENPYIHDTGKSGISAEEYIKKST